MESIKRYLGVKDSEIHVIIASTDWIELLLPYSRFCADTSFSIEGIKIDVSEKENDYEVSPIIPLQIMQGRLLAPWHNMYFYQDPMALKKGIAEIEHSYRKKGIEDYVIVSFHLPNSSTLDERRAVLRERVARMVNVSVEELSTDFINSDIPKLEYIAYFAVQILSKEQCIGIISLEKELFEETIESISSLEDEEAFVQLYEYIECAKPSPKCDHYEIGTPAKFSILMECCSPMNVIRHGIFQRNNLLTNKIIFSDLCAEDGSTGQKYKKTVDMKNTANVKCLKEDIVAMLDSNPIWKNHILRIIDEVSNEFPSAESDIYIFNPSTGIFTVYYAITKENGVLFLPEYHIIVRDITEKRMYFGALEANGEPLPFKKLLEKYYYGDISALLLTATWGGSEERDSDIIEDLGAQYRSYRCDIADDAATGFFYNS